MADAEITQILQPQRLPSEVMVTNADAPRFTPRELEMIKAEYGVSFSQIIQDDDSDAKYPVLAWLKLRRQGYDITLDEMQDIVISIVADVEEDPTKPQPSNGSPPSAGSGG